MKKIDWLLVAAWAAYIVFVGPWLISAPSWIAVGLGLGIPVALLVVTVKRVLRYLENE